MKKYREKRDFSVTNEPAGEKRINDRHIFVVQHHLASHDHYDFRLQWGGVLVSFAVPKGPSFNPNEKRLAVHVEDHPVEYADFEGVIPKGQYGGGTVMLWDRGYYEMNENFDEGMKKGSLKFVLFGQRLKGKWALVKLKNENDDWLLIKEKDEYAVVNGEEIDAEKIDEFDNKIQKNKKKVGKNQKNNEKISKNSNIFSENEELSKYDTSVKTGQTMQEIAEGTDLSLRKNPFQKVDVQLCKMVNKLPNGKDYLFEIKYDGYRIVAFSEKGETKLQSRNHVNYTKKFDEIAKSINQISLGRAFVLDGEVVLADDFGMPSFQDLQSSLKSGKARQATYVIFDLLALNGEDLRVLPLIERKAKLEKLLTNCPSNLMYCEHIIGSGQTFFKAVQKMGLEGVVGKKIDSAYRSERNDDWIKCKCYRRQEFVVAGFVRSEVRELSALLLGAFDDKKFVYVGRVGTGIDEKTAKMLLKKILPIVTDKSPFSVSLAQDLSGVTWTEPKVVVEIQFAELTKDKILRQASFKGVREDKDAQDVVLEVGDKIDFAENAFDNKNDLIERKLSKNIENAENAKKTQKTRKKRKI